LHVSARRRRAERHGAAVLRAEPLPLGLEPALAQRLPARGARARRAELAPAARPPGDLGLPGRDDGRDDARHARSEARGVARGADMSERSIGRHLADAFHLVPAGSDPAFADAVLELVEREDVDAVLPQSSFDLEGLAEHRDRFPVPVLVSRPDTIRRSNDKAET